jgi:hypothetical protein
MYLTSILYPSFYLQNLIKLALLSGSATVGSIVFFGTIDGLAHRPASNWRDIAVWGSIGTIIGAQLVATKLLQIKRH